MRLNKLKIVLLPIWVIFTLLGSFTLIKNSTAGENRVRRRGKFEFALIGDVPYGDNNVGKLDNLIEDVNAERKLRFVLHAGDIKSGSSECSDELFQARLEQYQKFRLPFILTPGDNEWTDCHRTNAGEYNPIERLEKLREIFYPRPGFSTIGRINRVLTQAKQEGYEDYVENQLWIEKKVVFSTIHVVGSNNNLALWSGIGETDTDGVLATSPEQCAGETASNRVLCEQRTGEFVNRLAAATNWLETTFDAAEKADSPGIFIMIHANPRFDLAQDDPERAGFNRFLKLLSEKVQEFGRPVILAHGDFHFYLLDRPLPGVNNFTRVQTFGADEVNWIRVTVDPKSAEVFKIEPVVVEENL